MAKRITFKYTNAQPFQENETTITEQGILMAESYSQFFDNEEQVPYKIELDFPIDFDRPHLRSFCKQFIQGQSQTIKAGNKQLFNSIYQSELESLFYSRINNFAIRTDRFGIHVILFRSKFEKIK